MIQTDRCDHTGNRILHSSSRIHSSAQSCFQSHIINTCICKDHHPHQKKHLKISRMIAAFCNQFIRKYLYFLKGLQESIIINIHLIDLEAFIDLHQMRRSK